MNVTKKQLLNQLKKAGVNEKGIQYVIRHFEDITPSRLPTESHMSIHDVIASRKMGWTQDSESRSAELPFRLHCEFSLAVLFVFSQPESIIFQYINSKGKKVTIRKTQDFLVVTQEAVYLVECKTCSQLERECEKRPEMFIREGDGYRCPPGEEAAADFGFKFTVSTDRSFPAKRTRNYNYLFNFIDELEHHNPKTSESIRKTISQYGNRVRLDELYNHYRQLPVIQAIFYGHILVNLDRNLLCHPDLVWAYPDRAHYDAIDKLESDEQIVPIYNYEMLDGIEKIWWDGQPFKVLNVVLHPSKILYLRKNKTNHVTLYEKQLDELIRDQKLHVRCADFDTNQEAINLLCSKKSQQVDEAMERLNIISHPSHRRNVSDRTYYRYKAAIKGGGDPLVNLLSNKEKRGNRTPRFSAKVLDLMEKHFKELLIPASRSVISQWELFVSECESKNLGYCSYESFNRRFKSKGKYNITLAQKGLKAAYALGPRPREINLDMDLPYHGDFIFEVAHIDHTPLEMSLVSKLNEEPLEGSLTLSIMYDGHSRMILAVLISFEKPSYRLSMSLIRECYQRHKRLPIYLVTDHGSDFKSNNFAKAAADLGCNHRWRQKGACRAGSIIERVFGITETELIHTLKGNKQLQKLGRGLSNTHKPHKFAKYTPDQFEAKFKNYAYHDHPMIDRKGIFEQPKARWNHSRSKFDELPGIKVTSQAKLFLATLPDSNKSGMKVLNKNTIRCNGFSYSLMNSVPRYDGEKISVRVKYDPYDPYDPSYIMACIANHWTRLLTNDELVRECIDRGIRLTHMEVYSRHLRSSRRYRNGPRRSAGLAQSLSHNEQHDFNVKKATTIMSSEEGSVEIPAPEEIKVNINTLPTLPVKRLEREE